MQRTIGLWGAVATLVGFVIGVSVFLLPGELAATAGPGVVISYGIASLIGLFALIAEELELDKILESFQNLATGPLFIAVLLLYVQILLVSWRWVMMLKYYKTDFPLLPASRLSLEGAFFNQALPTAVGGDAIRILRCRHYNMPTGTAVSSILLDRITGLVVLLVMGLAAQPAFWAADQFGLASKAAAVTLLAGFSGTILLLAIPHLPDRLRRFRSFQQLGDLGSRAAVFLIKPATATPILLISVLSHSCTFLALHQMANALGADIGLLPIFLVTPVAFLIAMLPISVGGWGLREGAMIQGMALFGVSAEDALAVSVLYGLMSIIVNIPGGCCGSRPANRRRHHDGCPCNQHQPVRPAGALHPKDNVRPGGSISARKRPAHPAGDCQPR